MFYPGFAPFYKWLVFSHLLETVTYFRVKFLISSKSLGASAEIQRFPAVSCEHSQPQANENQSLIIQRLRGEIY